MDDRFDDLSGSQSFGLCRKAWVYKIAQQCCDWSEPCVATRWELAQHGLGPESFVESTCSRTWSMSSRLCQEWLGLHVLHVHGFHTAFLHCFYRVPPALRSGLELLVFGDLSKVYYICIWCLYHMTGGLLYIYIYGYMRMGGQRTWCCKENMVLLCFLQDMSRLFVHKFKFWIVFNINDIYIVLTILELNLRLLVPNGPAGQHCPCQANRFKRKMQGCIATFDLYLLRSFKCPSRNLSNFVRVDCTSPVHMLIRFVVLATEPNRLPRHAHHRTFTVDIAASVLFLFAQVVGFNGFN